MTASEVFALQNRLADAGLEMERLAQEEAQAQRRGAFVASGDYRKSAEGRRFEELRAQVAREQEGIGGVVYRVPSERLSVLSKLEKLAKRARKLDVAPVEFRLHEERQVVRTEDAPPVVYRFVILRAGTVKLAGWLLLAAITVLEGGVLISTVPAFARGWAMFREGAADDAPQSWGSDDAATEAAQAHLDSLDLSAYRDEKRATACDHCRVDRQRRTTYLVESVETGEIKQVGSTCLHDFLGVDPHHLIRFYTYLSDIEAALDDEEGSGGGGRREWPTEDYLAAVCSLIRTEGWVSRSSGDGRPTATEAYDVLLRPKDRRGNPIYEVPTEQDEARAQAAIEWAQEELGRREYGREGRPLDEFESNLLAVSRCSVVPERGDGILAYLPVAHARFEEREIERRRRAEVDINSAHVGQVKERLTLTLTVESVHEQAGDYGVSFRTKLTDDEGNVFMGWFSNELARGERYVGKWTVKRHDVRDGVKQTVLARPDVRKESDPPPPQKPTKAGQRVAAEIPTSNDRVAVGEIEKLAKGYAVYVGGERVGEESRWDGAQSLLVSEWHAAEQRRQRNEFLSVGLAEGQAVKRGSRNPYTSYRASLPESAFVADGELVALRPRRDGDSRSTYSGAWVPARPPQDNEDPELIFVEARVVQRDDDGTFARACGPDGVEVPLGELDVIVRVGVREEVSC